MQCSGSHAVWYRVKEGEKITQKKCRRKFKNRKVEQFQKKLITEWRREVPGLMNYLLFRVCEFSRSSDKQTVLVQFFTCDFLINKIPKNPENFYPYPQTSPWPLFILKDNYIYNHVKKVYLQIWKYSRNSF